MSIATRYHNFQSLGAPKAVADFAATGGVSPNLDSIRDYLVAKYGGQTLGIAPYPRPVVGGSSPSTHTWGALDWRYQDPGPGRAVLLRDIIPFLLGNSAELGIQSLHDYVGSGIWRPPAWRGSDDPDGDGWKQQAAGSQMGQSWAQWIHVEVHPDTWFDARSVLQRVGGAVVPPLPPPAPFVAVIDTSAWQFSGFDSVSMTLPEPVFEPELRLAKERGVAGVIARAVNGVRRDPAFAVTMSAAGNAGLARGGYHYLRPDVADPWPAADAFLAALDDAPAATLAPMADCESFTGEVDWSPRRYADWLHLYLDRLEAGCGRRPIIYTGDWWWNVRLAGVSAEFAGYDFMLSDYPSVTAPSTTADWYRVASSTGRTGPDVPAGIGGWAGWQWTSTLAAADFGFAAGHLDGNLVKPEAWLRWNTTTAPLPPPPASEVVTVDFKGQLLRPATTAQSGYDVVVLQSILNGVYAGGLKLDGQYGPASVAAVKKAQGTLKEVSDGIVGNITWGRLLNG